MTRAMWSPYGTENRHYVDEPIDQFALDRLANLSPREFEVLQYLLDGRNQTATAEELFVSPHTVRTHVRNILAKLGAHSSLEAVSLAVRAGMRPRSVDRYGLDGYGLDGYGDEGERFPFG
jgi:DNA-binding CsgD family transcriptional regulator